MLVLIVLRYGVPVCVWRGDSLQNDVNSCDDISIFFSSFIWTDWADSKGEIYPASSLWYPREETLAEH